MHLARNREENMDDFPAHLKPFLPDIRRYLDCWIATCPFCHKQSFKIWPYNTFDCNKCGVHGIYTNNPTTPFEVDK
jgi:hypothetical protein